MPSVGLVVRFGAHTLIVAAGVRTPTRLAQFFPAAAIASSPAGRAHGIWPGPEGLHPAMFAPAPEIRAPPRGPPGRARGSGARTANGHRLVRPARWPALRSPPYPPLPIHPTISKSNTTS